MQTIDVTYKPDGTIIRKASGFAGDTCREATRLYTQRQNGVVLSDTPTDGNDDGPQILLQDRVTNQS